MNRVDRLFGILTLLQSKSYVTAEQISQQFNMSVRTVYRDIKALGEQGIPVGFESHKGYFIVQGYFLPPVSFTSDEANALMLMEYLVTSFADKSIQLHYSNALTKVKSVLKNNQKENLQSLGDHIKFQFPENIKNDFEYLSILQQCITHKHIIRLDYKNHNGEASQREVEPIGMIFYAFNWHLIGWCHLRNDYRDFKVSRIQQIHCTNIPFSKQEHIHVSEYMKTLPVKY